MTISYISGSSNYTNTAGDQITVTAPASIQDDDLLIYCLTAEGAPLFAAWAAPAGWTEIDSNNEITGRDQSHAIGYRVASSESGDYSFELQGTTSGEDRAASVIVLRGIDTSTPLDVSYLEANHYSFYENDFTPTNDPITTSTDGAWVILTALVTTTTLTAAAPSGYTLRIDESNGALNHQVATKDIATATTETPAAWGYTGGVGNEESSTFTLAIRPTSATTTRRYSLSTLGVG